MIRSIRTQNLAVKASFSPEMERAHDRSVPASTHSATAAREVPGIGVSGSERSEPEEIFAARGPNLEFAASAASEENFASAASEENFADFGGEASGIR